MTKIFCIEGQWNSPLEDRSSVVQTLETLNRWFQIGYAYERALVREQFAFLIKKWRENVNDFKILYIACHGTSEKIALRHDGEEISLDEISAMIGDHEWGGVMYFGSCGTFDTHGNRLKNFCKKTGVKALIGYRSDVDYFDGLLLDAAILHHLARYERFTTVTISAVEKKVRHQLKGIAEDQSLKFVVW